MAGQEVVTCVDEINRFLDDFPYERNNGDSIFIHKSILEKFSEKISSTGWQMTDENTWPYNLHIGKVNYEMYLVWIKMDNVLRAKLHLIVPESKYSFPWATNLTIYTTVSNFYLIELFIKKQKLSKFVQNHYVDATHTCVPCDIKVVEFANEVKRDLLPKFRTFLELYEYKMPLSYYAARAFKYLRPKFLKSYSPHGEHNPDAMTHIFLLLNYHRDQAKQGVEIFNLFDLIALKMGIDDNRFEYANCEFNKLIRQKLNEMSAHRIYIRSKRFNLVDYHNDLGIPGYSEEMYQYLVVQHFGYFDRLNVNEPGLFKVTLPRIQNINDILTGYFRKLEINVSSLKGNCSNILTEILLHQNLGFQPIIMFDTNHELDNCGVQGGYDKMLSLPSRNLKFVGSNSSCFIENFFNWLKQTIGTQCQNYDIKFVATKIEHPFILRGLTVRLIIIKRMQITCKLLRALKYVKYEILKMSKCSIETDQNVFMLLESLNGDRYIQINSNEYTLGLVIDSIKTELIKSDLKEFRFKSYITIMFFGSQFDFVDLSHYKFYFNETRTKIVTCDLHTDEIINLFDYFYRPRLEDLGTDE